MKDDICIQMSERTRLNFGPPQSYEEALLRFPDASGVESLFELRHLLRSPFLVNRMPIKDRMIPVSFESLKTIEQWSFRRTLASFRKTGWDYFLPHRRVSPFSSVFEADELHRILKSWKLNPVSDNPEVTFVCVKAEPGFVSVNPEIFLGFLKHEEYDLLFPQE